MTPHSHHVTATQCCSDRVADVVVAVQDIGGDGDRGRAHRYGRFVESMRSNAKDLQRPRVLLGAEDHANVRPAIAWSKSQPPTDCTTSAMSLQKTSIR
jgi:hypothetical protein